MYPKPGNTAQGCPLSPDTPEPPQISDSLAAHYDRGLDHDAHHTIAVDVRIRRRCIPSQVADAPVQLAGSEQRQHGIGVNRPANVEG